MASSPACSPACSAHPTIPDDATLAEICRFANAVGALATTERGAIPALPTRATVEARLVAAS